MAKRDPIEEMALSVEDQAAIQAVAVIETPTALVQPGASPVVAFPQTDDERAALERELATRQKGVERTPEQEAAYHARRYHICLALRGIEYERATVPIPQYDAERAALDHELENPTYYAPFKPVETMTYAEQNAFYIRRRQMMFALRGEPDDTTPAAKEAVRRCCG